MPDIWLRAVLICDDVRFEAGGTMTLVGVYADRIVVEPVDGELVLPRLAFYTVVAGLTGVRELMWRTTLEAEGGASQPLVESTEVHDPSADEHRLVHVESPIVLHRMGRHRLTVAIEAAGARRSIVHDFAVEPARA